MHGVIAVVVDVDLRWAGEVMSRASLASSPRGSARNSCRTDRRRSCEAVPPASIRCETSAAGWQYRLLGAANALVTANLRWLAGYRHPRHHLPETVDVLRRVFATPTPLMAGAEAAGDPIAVLPVLFHLLWSHELTIDLSTPLHQATLVSPSAGQR